MRLSLCRWEDHKGSSEGHWLIREIPGAILHCSPKSRDWALIVGRDLLALHPKGAERAWGKDFSSARAERLLEDNPHLGRSFQTRADLLLAIEAACSPAPPATIREALTAAETSP